MITTKRKREGPSKLSLRSRSQSQTSLTQNLTSQDVGSSKSQTLSTSIKSSPVKSEKPLRPLESFPVDVPDLLKSPSPCNDDVVDLCSSPEPLEEIFKPSRAKKPRSAPTLSNLKVIKEEDAEEISPNVTAPAEAVAPAAAPKSRTLNAKLKSFEKAPPKKFPMTRQPSSENLEPPAVQSVKLEEAPPLVSKPLSPVNSSKVEAPVKETEKELPCPVCNKPAGKNRRTHMKNCAGKNGLSTAQLLQAIELQKKQAEERKELGLPFFLEQQQKVTIRRGRNAGGTENDASMQLALALSKSLKDAEEEAFLRQARDMLENQETFEGMTESQVDATIKAVIKEPSPIKKVKQAVLACESGKLQVTRSIEAKGRAGTSKLAPFMTTSTEERMRRVTEKVAMYLLDDDVSDAPQKTDELRPVTISSDEEKIAKGSELWKLAAISPSASKEVFFVDQIREFVSPSKSNTGLLHLEPVEPKYKPPPAKARRRKSSSLVPKPEPASPPKKKESGLSRDWSSMLDSRTMSDVVIYAKEDRELRAHRLVLLVRCPALVKDLASEVDEEGKVTEYMLLWSEYPHDVVMAVMEFIYSDTTCRAMKLKDDDLNCLEELAQRYELNELEVHINMLKKLREDIASTEEPKTTPKTSPVKIKSPSPKKKISESPDVSEESEGENGDVRTELSYLVSQMDRASMLPLTMKRPKSLSPVMESDPEPELNEDDVVEKEEATEKVEPKVASQQDLFESADEPDICEEFLDPLESPRRSRVADKTLTQESYDDWRNLDGLDYMEPSPLKSKSPKKSYSPKPSTSKKSPSPSPPILENSPISPLVQHLDTSPFNSQEPNKPEEKDVPLEVVTLSSDSVSQKSALTISPKVVSPSTPKRLPLDDSLEVFEDADLTRLEQAALKAYEKVMTPKAGPSVASTPIGSSKITPMANYSMMDSPQLQKELDRYGIKKLRKKQAKVILRHIYNELHPVVSSTPVARPQAARKQPLEKAKSTQVATKTSRTQPTQSKPAKKASPKKSPAKAKKKSPAKRLSLSQPEECDSFDELIFTSKKKKMPSASQPVHGQESGSDDSDADSSDNEGYGQFEGEVVDEIFTQALDTQTNIADRIEEVLKSDPGLYHRILTYEPIWLDEIKDLMKVNKVRCNATVLLDYLDDQCITYRHDHQQPARQTQRRGFTQTQRGRRKKIDL